MKNKVWTTLFFLIWSVSWSEAQIFTPQLDISSQFKSTRLSLAKLEQARTEVWQAWREANHALEEQQLPSLVPIEAVQPHEWELIEELPMPYYWAAKGEKPASAYPLFINIHGSGPKEQEWEATLKWTKVYKDAPSVYFIPQIPTEKRYRWWYQAEQKAWEKLFRLAFLSEDINPNQIYFMGISEGGYGSQRLGAFYSDYLAGAGPMAGGEPLDNAPVLNYRHIAFALETGENDTMFGRRYYTDLARVVFDQLAMAYPGDFKHRIHLQEGRGHGVDYTLVSPWLRQFVRDPYPKAFSWVNFPMDKRYRTGFYNLAVLEPFNIAPDTAVDRAVFDFRIEPNNQIYLSAHTFSLETRSLGELREGKLRVYLSPELVDLSKKVELYVNGHLYFSGKLSMNTSYLVSSCHTFADPMRLYPTAIDVQF